MISLRCPIGRDTDDGKGAGTGNVFSTKLEDLSTIGDQLARAANTPATDGST